MLKAIFSSLLITIYSYASVVTLPSTEGWLDDFEQAQELAQQKHRPLLIAFLGPDWCSSSDKLDEEILSSSTFLNALSKEIIFVRVNIPENFDQESFQGHILKEKYAITDCPSLILAKSTGEEVARLAIERDGPQEYARYVKEILSDFVQVQQFSNKKKLKKLKNDEIKSLYVKAGKLADSTLKKILLEEGLKNDHGPYFLLERYGELLANGGVKNRHVRRVRNKILARDPHNEFGYCRQLALLDFEALARVSQPREAKNVVKPLIDYLHKFGDKDLKNAWKLEMKISQYFFSHDEKEEALKHAHASHKIAPEFAQREVAQSIEYLESHVQ